MNKIMLPLANSALIISPDRPGEFVVVHRKEDYNLYCLPGGKVDPGENILDAITREVFEETGISFPKINFIPFFTDICPGKKNYLVTVFVLEVPGNIILKSQEVEMEPFWTTKEIFNKHSAFPEFNNALLEQYEKLCSFKAI